MVMLRLELPGKVDEPAPELDMMPNYAVAEREVSCRGREKEEIFCRSSAIAATAIGNWLGATLRQRIGGERRRFLKAGERFDGIAVFVG
jgi:hypothetical protein